MSNTLRETDEYKNTSEEKSSVVAKMGQMNTTLSGFTKNKSDNVQGNDRLIQSISMIKDILMSNMQLREDQIKLSEQHDFSI